MPEKSSNTIFSQIKHLIPLGCETSSLDASGTYLDLRILPVWWLEKNRTYSPNGGAIHGDESHGLLFFGSLKNFTLQGGG